MPISWDRKIRVYVLTVREVSRDKRGRNICSIGNTV